MILAKPDIESRRVEKHRSPYYIAGINQKLQKETHSISLKVEPITHSALEVQLSEHWNRDMAAADHGEFGR